MLNPTTSYKFSEADLQFVLELAKCGHVHLLSSQVTLIDQGNSSRRAGLSFKDYGGGDNNKCEGLQLPPNWVIEAIYTDENTLKITFGVLPIKL